MPEFPAARISDNHVCPMSDGPKPHVGGPILPPCSINVVIGGLPAARLGDKATCVGPPDVIAMGASSVLINGLPAARQTDQMIHGGMIVIGHPLTLIGDPAFSPPSVMTIEGTADFQSKVLRDLYFLSTLPSGQALLDRLQAAGEPIKIVEFTGPNSYCGPNSNLAARLGIATGSTVQYNPSLHANVYDSSGALVPCPPQLVLGHELSHALANSEGNHRYGQDPAPPASEPHMEEEEGQAIGTGSHTGQNPSENSLRSDLGLPQRSNHFITIGPGPGNPPFTNLRPGGP